MTAWDGKCPSGKHGLDFKGQSCDLCLAGRLTEPLRIALIVLGNAPALRTGMRTEGVRVSGRAAEELIKLKCAELTKEGPKRLRSGTLVRKVKITAFGRLVLAELLRQHAAREKGQA